MKYELKKEDYQILEKIVQVATNLLESLKIMARLETNNQNESTEYKQNLEKIKNLYGVEMIIYNQIEPNARRIKAMMDYINDEEIHKDMFEVLIQLEDNTIIRRRIFEKLDHLLPMEEAMSEMNMNHEKYGIKGPSKDLFQFLVSDLEVTESIIDDNYACFLSILKKYIESSTSIEEKEILLKIKYYLSFICDRVLEDLLREDFEIPSTVFLRAICVGEEKSFVSQEVKFKKRNFANEIMIEEIDKLLSEFDNDTMKKPSEKAVALIHISMLRTSFLAFSDEEVKLLKEEYEKKIKFASYLKSNPNNSEIEKQIREAYRCAKEDKTIPVTISFVK